MFQTVGGALRRQEASDWAATIKAYVPEADSSCLAQSPCRPPSEQWRGSGCVRGTQQIAWEHSYMTNSPSTKALTSTFTSGLSGLSFPGVSKRVRTLQEVYGRPSQVTASKSLPSAARQGLCCESPSQAGKGVSAGQRLGRNRVYVMCAECQDTLHSPQRLPFKSLRRKVAEPQSDSTACAILTEDPGQLGTRGNVHWKALVETIQTCLGSW
jgi:hypothetical protein